MKYLILLTLLVSIPAWASEQVQCRDYVHIPGGSINGSCSNGHCSGWVNGNSYRSHGNCSDGITFAASAFSNSNYVSGQCQFGRFSAWIQSESLMWHGSCSNGGNFSGSSFSPSEYVSGSCQENGSFWVSYFGQDASLTGSCSDSQVEE